jgi:hypothetical protein
MTSAAARRASIDRWLFGRRLDRLPRRVGVDRGQRLDLPPGPLATGEQGDDVAALRRRHVSSPSRYAIEPPRPLWAIATMPGVLDPVAR